MVIPNRVPSKLIKCVAIIVFDNVNCETPLAIVCRVITRYRPTGNSKCTANWNTSSNTIESSIYKYKYIKMYFSEPILCSLQQKFHLLDVITPA